MVTIAELNPPVDDLAAKGFEVRVEGLSPQLQEVLRSNGWLGVRHWVKIWYVGSDGLHGYIGELLVGLLVY